MKRVAVTGATGYVGKILIDRLLRSRDIEYILAIDISRPSTLPGGKVSFIHQDITKPFGQLFSEHRIDTVVHLAYALRQNRDRELNRRINVGGTKNTIDACSRSGVSRLVYLSSTTVYGAHSNNSDLLTEKTPVRPIDGFNYSEDKVLSEKLINEFSRQSFSGTTCILRSCPVMGPTSTNFVSRAFDKPFLVSVSGANNPMQFIHEKDIVRALLLSIFSEAKGIYNIAGSGSISWYQMAKMLNRWVLPLPKWILYPVTQLAWDLRLQSDSPSAGLNFIQYPWLADISLVELALGFRPDYSSEEAWGAYANRFKS